MVQYQRRPCHLLSMMISFAMTVMMPDDAVEAASDAVTLIVVHVVIEPGRRSRHHISIAEPIDGDLRSD